MDYLHGDKRRKRQMLVRWTSGMTKLDNAFSVLFQSRFAEYPHNMLELSLTQGIPFLLEHQKNHVIGTVTSVFFTRCRLTKRHVGKAIVLLHNDLLSVEVYHRFIQTCEFPAVSIGYHPDWSKMSVRMNGNHIQVTMKQFALDEISLVRVGKDPGAYIEYIWEEPLAVGENIFGMNERIPLLGSSVVSAGPPGGSPYGYAEGAVYV